MNAQDHQSINSLHLKPLRDRVHWIVKTKELYKSTHQKMGLDENKLLFYLLKNWTGQTGQPSIQFTVASLCELFGHNLSTDMIKENLQGIQSHLFWITSQNERREEEILTCWIQQAIFDTKKAEFTVVLSTDLYPYLVCLHELFNSTDEHSFSAGNLFKSKYSSRLYELFKIHQALPEFVLTLEQLRYLTEVKDGKLERWVDLKRRVVEPSLEEINKAGELNISYQAEKTGRSVTAIRFFIRSTS